MVSEPNSSYFLEPTQTWVLDDFSEELKPIIDCVKNLPVVMEKLNETHKGEFKGEFVKYKSGNKHRYVCDNSKILLNIDRFNEYSGTLEEAMELALERDDYGAISSLSHEAAHAIRFYDQLENKTEKEYFEGEEGAPTFYGIFTSYKVIIRKDRNLEGKELEKEAIKTTVDYLQKIMGRWIQKDHPIVNEYIIPALNCATDALEKGISPEDLVLGKYQSLEN
ncbi:MAG: hypothetical protein GOV01_03505 [Candidatus Altiarchaeota archaeon]|nr:hypothetical protein [Candidatus Altiarchaeota archaeon]